MKIPIPILLYHSISEDVAPKFRMWSVRPKTFAAHMEYLWDNGYTPVTVTQLTAAIANSYTPLPDRPVVITFDDGLADFYTGALPILHRYGFTATLYVTTEFVGDTSRWLHGAGEGNRLMLSWKQLAEIRANGIELGAHTCTHPQLDTITSSSARNEIFWSKEKLEQHLGQSISTFAYPHGYYNSTVRQLVQQAGYSSACAVKHAMSTTNDDCFALARIIVYADTDIEDFGRLLTGRNLRLAPFSEDVRTKGWRIVRRLTRLLGMHSNLKQKLTYNSSKLVQT